MKEIPLAHFDVTPEQFQSYIEEIHRAQGGGALATVDDLVVEPFDHTFLNKDVAHFGQCVPTAENIALHIADLLQAPIATTGASLHKVRLQESPNNAAEVFAEAPLVGMRPLALDALAAV